MPKRGAPAREPGVAVTAGDSLAPAHAAGVLRSETSRPQVPAGAGLNPARALRGAAVLGLRALVRAAGLALAAWIASGLPAPGPTFLLTWTGLLFLPLALLGLLELPLALSAGTTRPKAALLAGAVGAASGLLGLLWISPLWALGWLGPLLLATGGALAGAALPARVSCRRGSLAGLVLMGSAVLVLAVIDPEGQYNARYAENRLSEEDTAAAPVFGDRAPASLSDLEVARALASTWIRTHPQAQLRWSWEEAVALEGLLAYGDAAGDEEPARFAAAWTDAHREESLACALWADAAAPAATALKVDGPEHPAVRRVRAYLEHDAPRTRGGCFSHLGLLAGGLLPPQAWADSLFMHGVFLNRLARGGDRWALEESARFGRAMLGHVRDEDSGLMRHAWIGLGPAGGLQLPVEPMFWARGNGWTTWFLVDAQLARRACNLPPDPVLQDALLAQLDALRRCQAEDGLWRTDLLGPAESNPTETSASALFAAAWGRAREADLIERRPDDADRLARARAGVRGRIRWERGHPVLTGTSTGTSPFFTAIYRWVPVDDNVGHGVGAALLLLSQTPR